MSAILRKGVGPVLSTSVEYHGFVYLAGITADDLSQDVTGQTQQVLAKIDAALEEHGTDKTRLLQAQVWLKDIRDRDAMNKLWSGLAAPGRRPRARLRRGQHGRPAPPRGDHGHRLPLTAPGPGRAVRPPRSHPTGQRRRGMVAQSVAFSTTKTLWPRGGHTVSSDDVLSNP